MSLFFGEPNNCKNKVNRSTEAQLFHFSNHHEGIPYRILGSKTVKNVHIDPLTSEIWPTELFVTLSVSETLVRAFNNYV